MSKPIQGGRIRTGVSLAPNHDKRIRDYAEQFTGGNFSLAITRLTESGFERERELALRQAGAQ
jgi:hypothetical protein